ncbi:hypothetical protein QBC39DRAFT_24161 [Podospora conica]|nr:hypothetical protein QBC39DRAFT_24161 [Schizothecium conicum]
MNFFSCFSFSLPMISSAQVGLVQLWTLGRHYKPKNLGTYPLLANAYVGRARWKSGGPTTARTKARRRVSRVPEGFRIPELHSRKGSVDSGDVFLVPSPS